MKYLFLLFLISCSSSRRLDNVILVNNNLEITFKGDTVLIELEDEQEKYFFNVKGKEYSLIHYRDGCKWYKGVYSCDNYVIFNDELYNVLNYE